MAGGIFTDRPFHFNTKCLVFSFYSALLYYAGGGRNIIIITLIFILAYILMAWYDYKYNCDDFMYTGTGYGVKLSPIFKPQHRKKHRDVLKDKDEYDLVADQEKAYLRNVYFFHTFIIAPLLLYSGYLQKNTPPGLFGLIGGVGAIAGVYHGARLIYPREVWK